MERQDEKGSVGKWQEDIKHQFERDDRSETSFCHGIEKWNSKMPPYILAKYKGTHIRNLTRTAHFFIRSL